MQHWDQEQIELCRLLSEKLPKKEPKVGESWMFIRDGQPVYVWHQTSEKIFQIAYDHGVTNCIEEQLLHPLYTEGELLELLRFLGLLCTYCDEDTDCPENCAWVVRMKDGKNEADMSLLTALLKLAVEVMKGESG